MIGKERILEELGDSLLPNLVNQALVANDRAKYLMTLLQAAREHADDPAGRHTNLRRERVACGIDDASLDYVVPDSRRVDQERYQIPQLVRIRGQLGESLQAMLAPLQAMPETETLTEGEFSSFEQRLDGLLAPVVCPSDPDHISRLEIDQITSAQPASGDSLHLLVMQLHKQLNRLQREIASDAIDGARVYGLQDSDRTLVEAFMRGVNATRALKLDHPGLDTTATRTGEQLIIQNDIGTTDAHVIVVHVVQSQVTITYTDIHIQRLIFFQNMLERFSIDWEDTRSRHSTRLLESVYHLCVGRFQAASKSQLQEYLEFLGSRLVFLIDWNRARKRLRKLVPKRGCVEVLKWAADNNLGHMAFLQLGGEQLVFDALQLSARVPLQMGGQLSDMLGVERAADFLKFTLKTAAEGVLTDQSELLIRDQIRAELRHYLDTAHHGLLELVSQHASLMFELATATRDCLLLASNGADHEYLRRAERRAKRWEHMSDELVTKARNARDASVESEAAAELLRIADDACDDLEEGVFLVTLLESVMAESHNGAVVTCRGALSDMAGQLLHASQEYVKAVENARCIHRGSPREEMADFLQAVDNTISREHDIDDAHRRIKASILSTCDDFRLLHLLAEVNDKLESASDAIMRAALVLRDYVLGEVITR